MPKNAFKLPMSAYQTNLTRSKVLCVALVPKELLGGIISTFQLKIS
jgi:hypothetical protein